MSGTWADVKAHLIRSGHAHPDGTLRRAQTRECATCHALILTGLDDDIAAVAVRVDPNPLTPLGEALAHIDGLRTYSLQHEAGRLILNYRDHWRIAAWPAGTRGDVMAEHTCQPHRYPSQPSSLRLAATALDTTCPF